MIKFEHTQVVGFEPAIRGMRNAKNSWDRSDSSWQLCPDYDGPDAIFGHRYIIGPNDLKLMMDLRNDGTDHRKFMRMIVVYVDITAPLYFWKEFDTYKVGTVANSCSTMHTIHQKKLELDDFSTEHLTYRAVHTLGDTVDLINHYRNMFINWDKIDANTKNANRLIYRKDAWWQMIQLLPTSYNQRRTVKMNYEVLANIYKPTSRRHHKQAEWNVDCDGSFCQWIKTLPYSQLITGEENHIES